MIVSVKKYKIMINEIYVNGELILCENPKKQFKNGYKIRCVICENFIDRKWYEKKILEVPYECKTCVMKYKNPMYRTEVKEKHKRVVVSDQYRKKMSELTSGEKNGFYGKTHTKENIEKIKVANKKYWENIDEKTRKVRSEQASMREKKLMEDDPVGYRRQKSEAARVSHRTQFMNVGMNKIETIVCDYLNSLGIIFDYSAILASYQYDFIIRGKRILIEVDGDYWHGIPEMYNLDGLNGKKKLNKIQLKKKERDKEKEEWAISRGFKIIRIWEKEIQNGTFKNKLKEL